MRVAVTGGSGLLGRRIVSRLARDHEVVNIDIRTPRNGSEAYVECSILDVDGIQRAIHGYDAVVHAAALPGPRFGTPEELMNINAEGSLQVGRACSAGGVKRLVFISSDSVLGFVFSDGEVRPRYLPIDEGHPLLPSDPYGKSKLLAETYLEQEAAGEFPLLILRPPWIWVPDEYEQCRNLLTTPEGWSSGLWAYVHGDDVAEAVARGLPPISPWDVTQLSWRLRTMEPSTRRASSSAASSPRSASRTVSPSSAACSPPTCSRR